MESGFVVPAHNPSKAALNMLTSQFAAALPGVRIVAVTPGCTATDLDDHRGTDTLEEGVRDRHGGDRRDRRPDRVLRRRDRRRPVVTGS